MLFYATVSGIPIIWRWRIFVHFSRILSGCHALSFQWSLVNICGCYVSICAYTTSFIACLSLRIFLILFFFNYGVWGKGWFCLCIFKCVKYQIMIKNLFVGMLKWIWILLLLFGRCLTVCRHSGQGFRSFWSTS